MQEDAHLQPDKHQTRLNQRSEWAKMQDEIQQSPQLRQDLIRQLEGQFPGFSVITYFSSSLNEKATIDDEDAEAMEELLAARANQGPVMLLLDSPGGNPMAAERIANVCQAYSQGKFEVIVPHMAKSAATMICFGASTIHMSITAELGPVDPQIAQHSPSGGLIWISADEMLRSYDELMFAAAKDPDVLRVEPYLQQLARYDSRRIEQVRSWRKLCEDISVNLLKKSQIQSANSDEIKQQIKIFLEQEHKAAHGRRIGIEEARDCGLRVSELRLDSSVWKTVWSLYRRSSYLVSRSDSIVKLMETAHDSVYA